MSNALWWLPTVRDAGRVYDASDPGRTVLVGPYDVARVAALALTQDSHTGNGYILNGPHVLTAREQVGILADMLGQVIEFVAVTPEQFAQRSIEHGPPKTWPRRCGTSTRSSARAAPAWSPTTSPTSPAPRPGPSASGARTTQKPSGKPARSQCLAPTSSMDPARPRVTASL